MQKLIVPAHHSITDWDFQFGASYRTLDTAKYVSAPKSLKFHGTASPNYNMILSRVAGTTVLPQGEVRTWIWSDMNPHYLATLRNQAAVGVSNYLNTYIVYVEAGQGKLWRYISGSGAQRATCSWTLTGNVWNHVRTVWWNGVTGGGTPALAVALFLEVAGAWVQQGATMFDTSNYWSASAINRCGIFVNITSGHDTWYDDTEIWGP